MIGYIDCACGRTLKVSDNWSVVKCPACERHVRIKPDRIWGERESDDEGGDEDVAG